MRSSLGTGIIGFCMGCRFIGKGGKMKKAIFVLAMVISFLITSSSFGIYQFYNEWGSEGSGDEHFLYPQGIATDSSGYVYVVDWKNYCVKKFADNGDYITKFGSFAQPRGVAVDSSGNVYVADVTNDRIQKFASDDNYSTVTEWTVFDNPFDVTISLSGNIYVTDQGNNRILFSNNGGSSWGLFTNTSFVPYGITVDNYGEVYVTDYLHHSIHKYGSNGSHLGEWSDFSVDGGEDHFNYPLFMDVDIQNNLYVSDSHDDRFVKLSDAGDYLDMYGASGSGEGQFNYSAGIAVDSSGYVYVGDEYNHRVQVFTPEPTTLILFGLGGLILRKRK